MLEHLWLPINRVRGSLYLINVCLLQFVHLVLLLVFVFCVYDFNASVQNLSSKKKHNQLVKVWNTILRLALDAPLLTLKDCLKPQGFDPYFAASHLIFLSPGCFLDLAGCVKSGHLQANNTNFDPYKTTCCIRSSMKKSWVSDTFKEIWTSSK